MATKDKFGVPTMANDKGILMPKLKFRFRVTLLDGFGIEGAEDRAFTQNVVNVTRPKVSYEEVEIHSYNSRVYVQGKHAWEAVQVVLRDDITNSVSRLVGAQQQRQLNHLEQTSPLSGSDYKFDMKIEILDGSTAAELEFWELEGCFLTNVDYSDSDYATNEPVQITMTIRYDNAIHKAGPNAVVGSGVDMSGAGDNVFTPSDGPA